MNKRFEDMASERGKLLFDFENAAMQELTLLFTRETKKKGKPRNELAQILKNSSLNKEKERTY